MVALKCPRCATIVRTQPGAPVVCPQCRFSGTNPVASKPAPKAPAPVAPRATTSVPAPVPVAARQAQPSPITGEPRHAPPRPVASPDMSDLVSPLEPPPKPRQRSFVVAAALLATVVVLAVIGAAFYMGLVGGAGGSVTEQQLLSALSSFHSAGAESSEGSPDAFGLEGTVSGMPGGSGAGALSGTFRMMYDPGRSAYELSYQGGGGGISVDVGLKQVGKVINYVQGTQTFESRDEDPSTLPALMNFEELSDQASLAAILDNEEIVVEHKEGVRHRGEAATKFVVHARSVPAQRGSIIVYDESLRVARVQFAAEGVTATMDALYGREVDVKVSTGHARASFVLGDAILGGFDGHAFGDCGLDRLEASDRACTVPDGHAQEVRLSEVELRAVESGPDSRIVARLRADQGPLEGEGVRLAFEDVDGDGLLSAGDRYSYDFAGQQLSLEFYDLWADRPAGGPGFATPGPEALGILAALGLPVALLRRGRAR